jgi:hypothetical protein
MLIIKCPVASSQEPKASFRTVRKDTIKGSFDVATSFDNCCQVYVKYVNLIVTSSTYETARLRPAMQHFPDEPLRFHPIFTLKTITDENV